MTYDKLDGDWVRTCESKYEWDVPIPDSIRTFTPPAGVTLVKDDWWESRMEAKVAEGETEDWNVVVHMLDVSRKGDVVVSLSRTVKPGVPPMKYDNGAPFVGVTATDDQGVAYKQDPYFGCNGGYWTTTLRRQGASTAIPSTITLTVHPYCTDSGYAQVITFTNVPLPARQAVDEFFHRDPKAEAKLEAELAAASAQMRKAEGK